MLGWKLKFFLCRQVSQPALFDRDCFTAFAKTEKQDKKNPANAGFLLISNSFLLCPSR